jgi:methylated-DNA-[protein]-cysteine S-methyltransferase
MSLRADLIKGTCRRIREARKRWDAHENLSCRRERERALESYEELTKAEQAEVPEELRVWLRYRSEKYFGKGRKGNGMSSKPKKAEKEKKKSHAPTHSVSFRQVTSSVGHLIILASKKGVSGLYFGHRIETTTLPKENRRDKILNQAEAELAEYFAGERERFTVPLDAKGSSFQREVWRQLSGIPFGETRGYGELAENMDNPKAVRAVGTANGANPISIIVPCHRVIGKDGSLIGFGGGLDIKEKLLRHEGLLL